MATRKRKPTKQARSRVDETNHIFVTFKRTAELLGEIEAGLGTLYAVLAKAGLMALPAGKMGTMTEEEAARVLAEAQAISQLLSFEAKLVIPVIFLAVGDESAHRVFETEAGNETIH